MKLKNVQLLYNAAAHFNAAEKYPEGLVNELQKTGAESYEALFWAFSEMMKQAEMIRRFMGETPNTYYSPEELKLIMRPNQIPIASEMVFRELANALNTPGENEEIDLVLQEFQKKTTTD